MKQQWLDKLDESLVKPFYEQQSESQIEEGFNNTLSFGTAGIRSTFGIGAGRLNAFTVRKVALGFANYLKNNCKRPIVVIHFDTRHLSKAFCNEMATVLASNGIQTIISNSYKSTPELSFAVRHLQANAGIMITASHNPKNYNGIKVYNHEGGQLLPEDSEILSTYINSIDKPLDIPKGDFDQLIAEGKIEYLNDEVTNSYKQAVKNLVGKIEQDNVKVVLTSLHGTSLPLLSDILNDLDYNNYVIEQEQSIPDGDFPSVTSANPEEVEAFDKGIDLARQTDAKLVIATDPDADRFGFVEIDDNQNYHYFNGNEIGLILMKLRYQDLIVEDSDLYIIKSIVTSEMAQRLAESLNVAVNNVLTGFKYISDLLSQKETSSEKLLLAFEESHGYLAQSISRDKDAIQMVPLIIKYKNLLAQNGLSFKEILDDIYNNIGHFKDKTIAPMFEGQEGNAKIERIMQQFRQEDNELATICGLNIRQIEDYEKGSLIDKGSETESQLDLPKTNLIRFIFDEGFIALRPSGTEPKIKLYFSLNVENIDDISQQFVKTFIE